MSIGESVTEVVTLHGTGTFEEKVPVEGRMTLVERTCTVDVALRWVKGFDAVGHQLRQHHPHRPRAARTWPASTGR